MRLITMLTKRLFYLFYLTLFNADYKTLAACALIKIDYHPLPHPAPLSHKKHNKMENRMGRE